MDKVQDMGVGTGASAAHEAVPSSPKVSIPSAVKLPYSRASYEGDGGWKDGRLGQFYDLLEAVLKERGERTFLHPLLTQITTLDAGDL